ncbi:hypothetical protein [Amycolatopsis aidingensis]|uniref:hypothetical protein n=1 Tax=Amycolatopsis aidingensis TaxID=2842453 RepID=UPI001C0E1A54|nr:hypothetical protein [Amycolatopsis aidingensis]
MTARQRLARQQAQLLRALLAGERPPPGFPAERLRTEAAALRAKRRRITEALRPDLAERLGERYRPLFEAYAAAHPRAEGTSARQDAENFAAWLETRRRPRWWRRNRSR